MKLQKSIERTESMEDTEILDMFLARSEEAVKETQKKYADYCYSIAYGILRNKEDAEECVNDTILRAWESIPPNRPENLRTYLGRISRNLSIDRLKAAFSLKRGAGIESLDFSELEDTLFQSEKVWEKLDEEVLTQIINSFLSEQKKLYRIVFVQKYWYLLGIREIADKNGLSESKTASILYRMRNKLKKRLEKEGYRL